MVQFCGPPHPTLGGMMALTKGLHLPVEEPHWNVAMALRRPFFEDPGHLL